MDPDDTEEVVRVRRIAEVAEAILIVWLGALLPAVGVDPGLKLSTIYYKHLSHISAYSCRPSGA
jgi:hypothetical protein